MSSLAKPLILSVDDDQDTLGLIELLLTNNGYEVITADSGSRALQTLERSRPDLILLDAMMPQMSGYELCSRLQENPELAYIPVIFVTALGEEQDKVRAFAVGAVDYIVKPIQKDVLLGKIRSYLKTNSGWRELKKQEALPRDRRLLPFDFIQFKDSLLDQFQLPSEEREKFSRITPAEVYAISPKLGIDGRQMAQYMAKFLRLPYLARINPEEIRLGVLPAPFCKHNLIVPVSDVSAQNGFALSNPFDWELLDILKKFSGLVQTTKLFITAPKSIATLFGERVTMGAAKPAPAGAEMEGTVKTLEILTGLELGKQPVLHIANQILDAAVADRASDIHIESKEANMVVRFRIDGDLREILSLQKNTGLMLMSRFKALGGLDIAERRKPQDGAMEAVIEGRAFKLRLATTSTPDGESLVVRLLEPTAKPRLLQELGMTDAQVDIMVDFASRTQGLILFVGPTGSGKTTTIYSLLSQIDVKTRSLISVEDPVEYRIPSANQQQVNEKAGITFESLLKSAVRQDPDILFLGEVRDPYSAKVSMDFASTGHLTLTTVHTSNATTAIFRLERLGLDRKTMVDSILGVVAQRLLKKLCPYCKKSVEISAEEKEILAPFMAEIPSEVAHPIGCPKCNHTGYHGREGIYEIIKFDPEISERVGSGTSISEIRRFACQRGAYLISHHAAEKVGKLLFSPTDVYKKVLAEEARLRPDKDQAKSATVSLPEKKAEKKPSILVAEDDEDTRSLIQLLLESRGYEVTLAKDGIDALLCLGKGDFDLILSDINMPNLDGFKLLEMTTQKGIETPVIFLTGSAGPEAEARGFELGAKDFIKKPIKRDLLWSRVQRALERRV